MTTTEPTGYQLMMLGALTHKFSGNPLLARSGVQSPVIFMGVNGPEVPGHNRARNALHVARDRARNKQARATRRLQRIRG